MKLIVQYMKIERNRAVREVVETIERYARNCNDLEAGQHAKSACGFIIRQLKHEHPDAFKEEGSK